MPEQTAKLVTALLLIFVAGCYFFIARKKGHPRHIWAAVMFLGLAVMSYIPIFLGIPVFFVGTIGYFKTRTK